MRSLLTPALLVLLSLPILQACNSKPPMTVRLDHSREALVLQEQWSLQGVWQGLDYDPRSGNLLALKDVAGTGRASPSWRAHLCVISPQGTVLSDVLISGDAQAPHSLTVAHIDGPQSVAAVMGGVWNYTLHAYDQAGRRLWSRNMRDAVNDVLAADLDRDGVDEILAATNTTGIHALNSNGTPRWTTNRGHRALLIPASSAEDPLQVAAFDKGLTVFNAQGEPEFTINAVPNAHRYFSGPPGSTLILACGGKQFLTTTALTINGQILWHSENPDVPSSDYPVSAASAPDAALFALGVKNGKVIVLNTYTGQRLASTQIDERYIGLPKVTWTPATAAHPRLLIIAALQGMKAYTLTPKP